MADKAFTFLAKTKMNVLDCPVDISQSSITSTKSLIYNSHHAIWDTGATNSVITKKVADQLSLEPIGMTQVHTAGGCVDCNIYSINICLPNSININNVTVTEAPLEGFDVLIGMDIIGLGDFAVSSQDGNTMVSYRIPSDGPVDFVEQLKRRNARNKQPSKTKQKHKQERQAKKKSRKK